MTSDQSATVIITPRERFSVARQAFESVIANTPKGHQGIYVAGGVPLNVQQYLATACAAAGYELIVRPEFLSPNVARNLGLARAQSKYVVFLDNDVVVEPGWLDALVTCAEDENADLVTPLVLMGDPSERNMHTLGGILLAENEGNQISIQERHHVRQVSMQENARPLIRQPSDYAEFHCALVRRSIFDQIGPLDEQIMGAAEHVDLALHLRAVGGRGFAEPAAVVSYLPMDYTLGDLATYSLRWSDDWVGPTLDHLASKWNLSPRSPLLADYLSSQEQLRERCLVFLDSRTLKLPTEKRAVAQTIVQLLDQMRHLGYRETDIVKVRDAYQVASQLFAGGFRSPGRTFLSHLIGVAAIVASVGANPVVVAGALLYAAYAQGEFPADLGGDIAAMRRWLKRRVGSHIEAIVFTYSHLRSEDIARHAFENIDEMPIVYANAALIRMANGIEDRLSGDHRYFDSAAWLESSRAEITEGMSAFEAIAGKLGAEQLTELLRSTVSTTRVDASQSPLRPSRPLNFAIDRGTEEMRPLATRKINLDEAGKRSPQQAAKVRELADGGSDADGILVDPGSIEPANNGSVTPLPDGVKIVADDRPWAYSAGLSLPRHVTMTGPATVAIELKVDRGHIGVLILERGSSVHQIANEQDVPAGVGQVALTFAVAAIAEAGEIVFRGWPGGGAPTEVCVFSIRVTPC